MNLANVRPPTTLTFHLCVRAEDEMLYYAAVADPQDKSLILNYERRDYESLDKRIKESVARQFPKLQEGKSWEFITYDIRIPAQVIRDRFRRIENVSMTCEVPLSGGVPTSPFWRAVRTIKTCCELTFQGMKAETSSLKVICEDKGFHQMLGYATRQNDKGEFEKVWIESPWQELAKAPLIEVS